TAMSDLLRRNGDADCFGPALAGGFEQRAVAAADLQQARPGGAADFVEHIVDLIFLGHVIRRLGVTVINAFGVVAQAASGKETVEQRIAANDRHGLWTRPDRGWLGNEKDHRQAPETGA